MSIPIDDDGQIQPHDHPDLTGDRLLIRGVFPLQVVPNKNSGGYRLSSGVFKQVKPKDHLSCDDRQCLEEQAIDLIQRFSTGKFVGAVEITVQDIKAVHDDFLIGRVPITADPAKGIEENICHCGIWGKITLGIANALFHHCQWVVEIDGVVIPN